jgi:PadR family transcriptional regulator AphA
MIRLLLSSSPLYSYQEQFYTPDRRTVSTAELTTTSYAVLGLLGIQPWTTYELAQQMERSLKHFWPRAQSRIYEEPKRLAALGLAKATREHVGRRPRTTYTITTRGRRALQAWLAQPGAGPTLELEALLKVFYGEQATKRDVLANIDAIARWADRQNQENVAFARLFRDGAGPFPQRLAVITLTGKFMTDFADMLTAWTIWAAETVADWPEDITSAEPDRQVLGAIAGRPVEPATLPPQPSVSSRVGDEPVRRPRRRQGR